AAPPTATATGTIAAGLPARAGGTNAAGGIPGATSATGPGMAMTTGAQVGVRSGAAGTTTAIPVAAADVETMAKATGRAAGRAAATGSRARAVWTAFSIGFPGARRSSMDFGTDRNRGYE